MTERYTPSAFPWSASPGQLALLSLALALLPGGARAELPDGPGKAATERICKQCHELERSVSLRQDREGWQTTIDKMENLGAEGTEAEFQAILEYLAKNFPADEIPKLNVNKATAIEFETRLSLPRSQAASIIQFRAKNGNFKSIEDLKKVPGVDTAKIEAKKDRLAF